MPASARPERVGQPAGRWRARAFGLEIDASFEAPGLPPAVGPPTGPSATLDLAAPEDIDADWPYDGVERVLEESFDDGPPARTIDMHPAHGYRLYARHFGLARISIDGSRVVCAPPDDEPWSWQRFLVGRVLPWAAVLRGREVLHASAVAFGGRVVAFVGDTGAGKTSLAMQLVARGMEFFTDDVLALELSTGSPVAHPGAGIASIRDAERDEIPEATWGRLGRVMGHSVKTYVEVPRAARPLPLGRVYFLRREAGAPIERVAQLDPRRLLASTFVLGVQSPARLINQLDVCSAIARRLAVYDLRISAEAGALRLAEDVHEHLVTEPVA